MINGTTLKLRSKRHHQEKGSQTTNGQMYIWQRYIEEDIRHQTSDTAIYKVLLQSSKKNTDNSVRKCPKDLENRHFPMECANS